MAEARWGLPVIPEPALSLSHIPEDTTRSFSKTTNAVLFLGHFQHGCFLEGSVNRDHVGPEEVMNTSSSSCGIWRVFLSYSQGWGSFKNQLLLPGLCTRVWGKPRKEASLNVLQPSQQTFWVPVRSIKGQEGRSHKALDGSDGN